MPTESRSQPDDYTLERAVYPGPDGQLITQRGGSGQNVDSTDEASPLGQATARTAATIDHLECAITDLARALEKVLLPEIVHPVDPESIQAVPKDDGRSPQRAWLEDNVERRVELLNIRLNTLLGRVDL
jgi:hypothetical protein